MQELSKTAFLHFPEGPFSADLWPEMDEFGEIANEEEAPVTTEAEPVVPLPPLVVHPALRRAYCDAIKDVLVRVKARETGELGRDEAAADVIVARLKQVWLRRLKEEHRIDLLSELGDDLEDGARSQNGSMNSSPSVENGKRKRATNSSPSVRNGKKKRQGGKATAAKATADGPSSQTDSRGRKRRRKHGHLNLPKLGSFKHWPAGGSSGARRPLPAPLPLQPLPPPPPPSAILTGSGPLEANGGGPPTLLPPSLPDSFSTLSTTASQFPPLLSPVGVPFGGPPPFPPPALPPPPPVPLAPPPINANDILFGDDSDDDVQAPPPPPSAGLPLPPLVTPRPQEHMPSLDDLLMSDDISDHEGADNDGAGDGAQAAAAAAGGGGGGGGGPEDEQRDEDEASNGSGGNVRRAKANRMRRLLSGVGAVDVGDVEIEEETLQEEAIRAALAAQAGGEGEEGDETALKQDSVKMQSWAEFSQTLPGLQNAGDEEEEKEEEEQEKEEDGGGDGKRRKKLRKRRGVQFTKPDIDAATLMAEVDSIVLTDEEVFLPPERADRPSIMGKLVKFKRTDSWWRFTLEDCIYTSPTETFFLTELKCVLTSWLVKV